MTGAPAAFERAVSPPSLPSVPPLSHFTHSKKRSRQLDASLSLAPAATRSPFPTHWLSGANTQSISPAGFRGVAALPLKLLLLPFLSLVCCLSLSPSASPPHSASLQGGKQGTLEGVCVRRGKSGHVGLGERWRERGGKRGKREGGCRGMSAGLRNTAWQV